MSELILSSYRISPEQKRIWSDFQNDPALHSCLSCEFNAASVTDDQLRTAIRKLTGVYHILRTRFALQKGLKVPVQQLDEDAPAAEFRFSSFSLKGDESLEEATDRKCSEINSEAVNMQAESPLSACVIRQPEGKASLILAASAMALDSASLVLLLREIEDEILGKISDDGENDEAIQYAQLAEWLNGLGDDTEPEIQQFWEKQLNWKPAGNRFIFGCNGMKPAGEAVMRKLHRLKLSPALRSAIFSFAEKSGTTADGLLNSLLVSFLGRYTTAEHAEIYLTEAVRSFEEIAGIPGILCKTYPAKLNIARDQQSLIALAGDIAAMQEQALYFDSETSKPAKTTGKAELQHIISAPDLSLFRNIFVSGCRTTSGISLSTADNGSELMLSLLFATEIVSESWQKELCKQLISFLDTNIPKLASGNQSLGLSWISEPEAAISKGELFDQKPESFELTTALLNSSFSANKRFPALIHGSKMLTFSQLEKKIRSFASGLTASGAASGDLIGILLDRSADAVAAIMACWRIGAGFIPIDTAYPAERVRYMAEDSGMKLLLTDQAIADAQKLNSGNTPVVIISALTESETESDGALFPEMRPDSTAYVIYTSGSTGRPKGCEITHAQLAPYMHWVKKSYMDGIEPGTMPLFTSLAFDLTITTLFGSLAEGHTLRIFSDEQLTDTLESIFDTDSGIEIVKMSPAHIQLLAQTNARQTSVRRIIAGGEPLRSHHLAILRKLNPGITVFNEYGPTETVVGCSVCVLEPEDHHITIGKPVSHAAMYIADENGKPLPAGVPGELYIAGESVCKGYLNKPELTNVVFSDCAFTGKRVYKTGDRAALLPDGSFDFYGRVDKQLKIRGYRIEPGEIEFALNQHDQISAAFVGLQYMGKTADADPYLTAYIQAEDEVVTENDLQDFLSAFLPAYMIPSFFIPVAQIPLTVNGKVDESRLPALDEWISKQSRKLKEPSGPIEQELFQIWTEVLGHTDISVDDDFFEVGGQSLKAMQIVARIQKGLYPELLLSEFFDHLSIEKLAQFIAVKKPEAGLEAPSSSMPAETLCSDAQKKLWITAQMEGSERAYMVSGAYSIEGISDPERFNEAVCRVIKRHESLRTAIREKDGEPIQVIAPFSKADAALQVQFVDLQKHADPEKAWKKLAEFVLQQPFRLDEPGLFRSVLVRMENNEYRWLVCMHHIISDGWSVDVLAQEIRYFYENGANATLAEPAQYREFISWLLQARTQNAWQKSEEYWLNTFSELPKALNFPFARKRPPVKTYRGDTRHFEIQADAAAAFMNALPAGCTPFSGILSLVGTLIHKTTGAKTFCVGTPAAGRVKAEFENSIGLFINMLPIRLEVHDGDRFAALIKRTRGTLLQALTHQSVPFDYWISKSGYRHDPSRSPLFDTLVVYQQGESENGDLGSLRLTELKNEERASKYDLVFEFVESTSSLKLRINYNTDIFSDEAVLALGNYFNSLLAAAANSSQLPISELPDFSFSESALGNTDNNHSENAPYLAESESNSENSLTADLLRQAWLAQLGGLEPEPDTHFFEAGGDSIKAIQISASLRSKGFLLGVQEIFTHPVFNDQLRFIKPISAEKDDSDFSVIDFPSDRESSSYPLTPIQKWLFSLDEQSFNAFFQTGVLRFPADIPAPAIAHMWKELIRTHEVFRSRFTGENQIPDKAELISGLSEPGLLLTQSTEENWEAHIARIFDSWLDDFTLKNNPPYRAWIVQLTDSNDHLLFMAIHHSICDHVSWNIFSNTFAELSAEWETTSQIPLASAAPGFAALARQINKLLSATENEDSASDEINSFDSFFKNSDISETDSTTTDEKLYAGSFRYPKENVRKYLDVINEVYTTTDEEALAAVYALTLAEVLEEEKAPLLFETHGRDNGEIPFSDRTAGWFTRLYGCLINTKFAPGDVVRTVKEQRRKAFKDSLYFLPAAEKQSYKSMRTCFSFNFLGDASAVSNLSAASGLKPELHTPLIDACISRRVDTGTRGGFMMRFFGNEAEVSFELRGEKATPADLASEFKNQLQKVAELAESIGDTVHSPSDFDFDELEIDDLDALLNSLNDE
ncbi:MAG: amino acid adenylation domain-containing protein [Balneolales bacterium]|nr:amino acid adenylation domain-containing protein [Balneolales bacterium]